MLIYRLSRDSEGCGSGWRVSALLTLEGLEKIIEPSREAGKELGGGRDLLLATPISCFFGFELEKSHQDRQSRQSRPISSMSSENS